MGRIVNCYHHGARYTSGFTCPECIREEELKQEANALGAQVGGNHYKNRPIPPKASRKLNRAFFILDVDRLSPVKYAARAMTHIKLISSQAHSLLFPNDPPMSLCGRAYLKRHESPLWRLWVIVFTEPHCRRSCRYWMRQNGSIDYKGRLK